MAGDTELTIPSGIGLGLGDTPRGPGVPRVLGLLGVLRVLRVLGVPGLLAEGNAR